MKKVYVVNECCDDEYGCREAIRVFSTREKAQAFIDEQTDKVEETWFDEEYERYSIEEFEVE